MSYYWGGSAYELWLRIYDKRVLTEDGAYVENEVPTSYAGSELTVEYNHILVYANEGGQIQEFRQLDYASLMDKDDHKNNGYTYELYGHVLEKTPEEVDPADPGSVQATWHIDQRKPNPAAEIIYKQYLYEIGELTEDNLAP